MQREPRGLRGREKLRSILDAARRIVLADGLAQAKMSDIATEAKVSTATVYAYFPSKDDLFRAVVEAVSVDLEVRIAVNARDLDGDPVERLARVFMGRLNDHDLRALFRIMAVEGDRFPEIRAVFDDHTRLQAHKVAVSLFERLAEAGRFASGVAELASRQLLGMLEHETLILAVMRGDGDRARPDDDIVREAAATVWARFGTDLARSSA